LADGNLIQPAGKTYFRPNTGAKSANADVMFRRNITYQQLSPNSPITIKFYLTKTDIKIISLVESQGNPESGKDYV
jgi:hypothetical protein